jgi:hypothetical protein
MVIMPVPNSYLKSIHLSRKRVYQLTILADGNLYPLVACAYPKS